MAEDHGTFYGLGLGPGDPELITLKALAILKAVPVIAYPTPEEGASLTRAIASPHLPGGQIEIPVRTPIVAARFPPDAAYDRAANEIAGHLDRGRDVAWLAEGDPLFYGSFLYLHARLADRHRVRVVPGVSSLHACAAAAGQPLVARDQTLAVVPATLAEQDLLGRLEGAEAAAIVKVGRHLGKVRRVLDRLSLVAAATLVERATLAAERVRPLAEVTGGEAPYFSMVLVARASAEGR